MVDLSWAGRQTVSNPAHQALMRIQTGNPIDLVEIDGRWLIRSGEGVVIGRMAQSYRPLRVCVSSEERPPPLFIGVNSTMEKNFTASFAVKHGKSYCLNWCSGCDAVGFIHRVHFSISVRWVSNL
ncbi:hypothetical protein FY136_19470 [Agrobacterium tumefaciens]|uniref:hypothetical protein n=1 Tax=Agrobacterium tumefaciens TaxID=358 RepID=UPI0021D00F6C|nr:hypothetical protein [Agrobacterium tumefaciens]UXT51440.1 hypothetical protein FY136_19470 [Agrobacterium tumefaciens]